MHWITKKEHGSVCQSLTSPVRHGKVNAKFFGKQEGFDTLMVIEMICWMEFSLFLFMFMWMICAVFVSFIRTFQEITCDPLELDNGLGEGCNMTLHRSPTQWLYDCEWMSTSITLLIFQIFRYLYSTSSVLTKEFTVPKTDTSTCQEIETCNYTLIDIEVGEGVITNFAKLFGYTGFLCKVWIRFVKRMLKG